MSNNYFENDEETSQSSTLDEQNTALRPPDEEPYPPYEAPYEPPPSVSLNQVSPIAGSVAGGLSVTLTGSGFQPGAAVYFGSSPATQITVESDGVIRATSPASPSGAGSVSVSVINPDSSATLPGGFTYVAPANGEQAEIIGVTPLAVIEDTNTIVTIRGRNLIEAFNTGVLALRGPSRCQITFLGTTTSHDQATGMDTVEMNVNIKCSPALQPLERMAIQVLASRRSEAASDGVVESSKQMFTVLPKAVPVTLAYTANLQAGQPNLVMVSGRNLEGHSLALDDGTEVAFQNNDGNFISGIVTLPEYVDLSSPLQLSMLDSGGTKVAEYQMEIAPDSGSVSLSSKESSASLAQDSGELAINLTPAPNQEFIGPTANDSAAFDISSGSSLSLPLDLANFAFTVLDVTIILPIFNEVYLLPHFDGGGDALNSPVIAEVGKIFRLRGAGLLVAIRVEVQIHIQVVLIIGFNYQIWDYGFYNEFPEFGWSIGSMVIGIEIHISVFFYLSALVAIVKPNGQLKVLAALNLTLGFDFDIDADGTLRFDPYFTHKVYVIGIKPTPNNLQPCGGKFQLLSDSNGQTAFLDAAGEGYESYYFVREAGECCVPWDFNMQLSRFSPGGQEQVVQSGFQASYCLTAAESPTQYKVVITSVPPPVGIPPTLTLDIGETAQLKALAVPVDANGNPTGDAPQDLKDLGYDVEFFLEYPPETVDRETLLSSEIAVGETPGDNMIRAAVTSVRVLDDEPALAFWGGTIYGFRQGSTAGEEPRLIAGGLPVTVNSDANAITIEVTPVLAYEETNQNGQKVPVEAPEFQNQFSTPTNMWELERNEPFETQRPYFLAVKVNVPAGITLPANTELTFQVDRAMLLERFKKTDTTSTVAPPLEVLRDIPGYYDNTKRRNSDKPEDFFTGGLIVPSSASPSAGLTLTLTLPSGTIPPDKLFKIGIGTTYVQPNVIESNVSGSNKRLVPPGENVSGNNVLLKIPLQCSANNGVTVSFPNPVLNIVPTNNETFEEYLRVFEQVQTILSDSRVAYFKNFAKSLFDKLNNSANKSLSVIGNDLKDKGGELWKNACELIHPPKSSTLQPYLDDRPLYWARLQGIGAIRAYAKRKKLEIGSNANNIKLNMFEYPSRGLDINGAIIFPDTAVGKRKAIVTGFDPFQLYYGIDIKNSPHDTVETSNPSGLLALRFNGAIVNQSVYVRTAIFPVRYEDFNKQLVEDAIKLSLNKIGMVITTSQNGDENYYDLERWAARFRVDSTDNNNKLGISDPSQPPKIPAGKEYLESTLPLFSVIKSAEELEGPKGMAPFVIDQSYSSDQSRDTSERRDSPASPPPYNVQQDGGTFRPEPLKSDLDGHKRVSDTPNGTSYEGSGGNYLSNEIFYRVALVRNTKKKSLASGHFHVPPTGYLPNASGVGNQLIEGSIKAIGRLVKYSFRLAGPTSIAFSQPAVNTTVEQAMTITNSSTESILIGSIDMVQPFSVDLPSSLPIEVNPGESLTLTIKFTPTITDSQTGELILREVNGDVLLQTDLIVSGEQNQPLPIISGFNPQIAFSGQLVIINGQNFSNATDVRIGNINVPFTIDNATQITAEITDDVPTGIINVDTPSGTADSSTMLTVSPPPPSGDTNISFVGFDDTTKGDWIGVYGSQAYSIFGDGNNNPSWMQFSVSGQNAFTWENTTSDQRALRKATNNNDRIASTYYTSTQYEMSFNFTDGQTHRLALYALDWTSSGRQQTFEIIHPTTNQVLDTRVINSFSGGVYAVWQAQGAFKIRVSNNGGPDAVLSGVFVDVGTGNPTPTPGNNSAAFVQVDSTTQGNWLNVYGAQGYKIADDATNLPSWAQVSLSGQNNYTWDTNTTDARALIKGSNNNERIASTWYTTPTYVANAQYEIAFNFTDGQLHKLAIYCLDWNNLGRSQELEVVDGTTGAVLDTRSVNNFAGGVYVVWQVKGQITVRVKNVSGPDALVSGIFIDNTSTSSTNSATFVQVDSTTQGNWVGNYGAQGYKLAEDATNLPNWAQVSLTGQNNYVWAASTTDQRALVKPSNSSDRIAAIWYSSGSFEVNFNFTDGQAHKIALYCLDWTGNARSQKFEVFDGTTSALLDTQTINTFGGGIYVNWQVSGNIKVRITNLGPDAVVSGIFIDASSG